MKRKALISITAITLVLLVAVLATLAVGDYFSTKFKLGASNATSENSTADEVLATYKGTSITRAMLAAQKSNNGIMPDSLKKDATDMDFVNQIIIEIILLEEAKAKGFVAAGETVVDYEAYRDGLLAAHISDIVYYID